MGIPILARQHIYIDTVPSWVRSEGSNQAWMIDNQVQSDLDIL